MNCEDVRSLLQEHLDGRLTPEVRGHVENHLRGCAACRRELALLTEVVAAIESYPLVPEPSHLTARIMAQVEATRPVRPRFWLGWADVVFMLGFAGATALVLGVLIPGLSASVPGLVRYLLPFADALSPVLEQSISILRASLLWALLGLAVTVAALESRSLFEG